MISIKNSLKRRHYGSDHKRLTFEDIARDYEAGDFEYGINQNVQTRTCLDDIFDFFESMKRYVIDLFYPNNANTNPIPGLRNIGNSCYMNSTLQCLLVTPLVSKTIYVRLLSLNSNQENLATTFTKIIESRKNNEISEEDLKKLKKQVSILNKRFSKKTQEDAAEFLSTLICGIENFCLLSLNQKRNIENFDGEEIILKRLKSLMKNNKEAIVLRQSLAEVRKIEENGGSDFINLFRAQIYSEIKCKGGCDSEETCFEDRIMMELDLPKGKGDSDIMKCFERTFEKVYYNEENENFCDKCKKMTCFTRKEWISRLPKIMIIHLKRFETNAYGEQQRNNMNIEFPIEDLDVSPIVHDYFKESNPNFKYHLHGVSIHRGTLHGGHYTANIKNMSGDMKWYECDDNNTGIIDEPESYGAGPYVLFYHRNDVTI